MPRSPSSSLSSLHLAFSLFLSGPILHRLPFLPSFLFPIPFTSPSPVLSPVPLSVDFPSPENLRHPPRLHLSACVSFPIVGPWLSLPSTLFVLIPPFLPAWALFLFSFFQPLFIFSFSARTTTTTTTNSSNNNCGGDHSALSLCLPFLYLTLLYHIFFFDLILRQIDPHFILLFSHLSILFQPAPIHYLQNVVETHQEYVLFSLLIHPPSII